MYFSFSFHSCLQITLEIFYRKHMATSKCGFKMMGKFSRQYSKAVYLVMEVCIVNDRDFDLKSY